MPFKTAILAICLILAGVNTAYAQDAPANPGETPAPASADPISRPNEIIFSGKLYSPVKLSAILPFTAQILDVPAQIGEQVKEDQVLAKYEIPLETIMDEKKQLSLASIKELEYKQAAAEQEISRLSAKEKETRAMIAKNMATKEALNQTIKDIGVRQKEKASYAEQLALARSVLKDRLELAEDRFGKKVTPDDLPKTGVVKAPANGVVLWMNPDLRAGVKMGKDTELFQIGSMDPMIIRAQVHEIEAQKLTQGDIAKVTFDAIPGREFTASVSRIPWSPMPAALQQPSYYEIELTIPNPDMTLKEGLKGEVTVLPQHKPGN